MTPRTNLTQHLADSLVHGGDERKIWDAKLRGFHIRVNRTSASYAFSYRTKDGDQRSIKLGPVGHGVKVEAMRSQAANHNGQVALGKDPSAERKTERSSVTMDELFKEYLEKHARIRKRPRSVAEDERNWRIHLRPLFGRMTIAKVSKRDLDRLVANMKERPGAANRCVALLSKMFSLAVRWGYRPDNPSLGVTRYPENMRETYLTPEQARTLEDVLANERDRGAAYAIQLLLFTGARLSEVLHAKWDQFDLTPGSAMWVIPPERVKGAVKVRAALRRPLSDEAASLLREWRRTASVVSLGLVFPSHKGPQEARHDLKSAWRRVRTAAGLASFRLHDLRHTYASAAINRGASLYNLSKALGHRDVRTTVRYAHLADQPIRETAEMVGAYIRGR